MILLIVFLGQRPVCNQRRTVAEYALPLLSAGTLKMQPEGVMGMTFLATACVWRCQGVRGTEVHRQPLLPLGAEALASGC